MHGSRTLMASPQLSALERRSAGEMIKPRRACWVKLSASLLALTVLAPATDAAGASAAGGPPFAEGQASTKGSSCMGTSQRSPAECDPWLEMDAKTGAVRGDLSMTTPGGGLLPGWGRTTAKGKIVAIRRIARATRVVRFEVRFHLKRLVMSEEVLPCCPDEEGCKQLECWSGMGMLAGAQHMTCATCKGQSRGVRFESSKGDTDVRMLFSIRDSKNPEALVPAGDVRVAFTLEAGAWILPPNPLLLQPPQIGKIRLRISGAVDGISHVE